jgi:3-deoxy-D-arabino-heptulosonate 7-phosphate (DAHP) synthase class II
LLNAFLRRLSNLRNKNSANRLNCHAFGNSIVEEKVPEMINKVQNAKTRAINCLMALDPEAAMRARRQRRLGTL